MTEESSASAGSLTYPMFFPVEASPESIMLMYLAAVLCPFASPISPTPQLVTRTTKNKTHILVCATFSVNGYDSDIFYFIEHND